MSNIILLRPIRAGARHLDNPRLPAAARAKAADLGRLASFWKPSAGPRPSPPLGVALDCRSGDCRSAGGRTTGRDAMGRPRSRQQRRVVSPLAKFCSGYEPAASPTNVWLPQRSFETSWRARDSTMSSSPPPRAAALTIVLRRTERLGRQAAPPRALSWSGASRARHRFPSDCPRSADRTPDGR